jgi:hypothetical protein
LRLGYFGTCPNSAAQDLDHTLDDLMGGRRHRLSQIALSHVDFAKTKDRRWIVIECNDAQESGYAGIPPHELWRQVLARVEA